MRPGRFGRYAIRTADGVQEAAYLPIGGIEQYIRVRGRSRANPVLLVLHGGPGSTLGATACRWQGALEAAFTVVHWDQRGSGNTYYRDPAAPPPTVERLLSDLDELVDALRARYGRDRLFLLGHSWGSLLGGLYALRRPEKLSAWLPVSQMVDFKRSEQVSAAEAIRRARGAGREEDAERLAQELEQVLALRRLDRAGAGALRRVRRRKERYLPPQYGGPSPLGGLAAPELTGNDLRWKLRFDRMLAANAALYEELLGGLSLDGCPPRYGVPVILTAGERDWTTPYPLAAAYYDTLSAPCKVFLSLPDALAQISPAPGRWVTGGLLSVGAAAQHGVELCPGTVVVPVAAAAVGAAGQVAADVDRALILLRRGHRDGHDIPAVDVENLDVARGEQVGADYPRVLEQGGKLVHQLPGLQQPLHPQGVVG